VVRLESDVVRRDVYGRRLAYVRVHGTRFNDVLVARGYARFFVIPPNDLHARDLLAEELEARRHRRGLWGEC
jgi:endonuclease YncB( thermonuclease family)